MTAGERMLLTEEKIISMVTDFNFSGETNRHILCNKVAKAQLKKVEGMGLLRHDPDVYGHCKSNCRACKALLKEVSQNQRQSKG